MNNLFTRSNLIFVFVVAVFVFGFWGFYGYEEGLGDSFDFWGSLYAIISFFVLETTGPAIPNYQLIIAKFLAAIILGLGFFQLVYKHVSFHINVARIKRSYREHYVVTSLSKVGYQLAIDLLRLGKKVIVFEKTQDHPNIDYIKQRGGIVFEGTGLEEKLLKVSKVTRASQIVACSEDDNLNLSIASEVVRLAKRKKRESKHPLRLLVHIQNETKNNILKDYIDLSTNDCFVDIDSFNVHHLGAQLVFDRFFPYSFLTQFSSEVSISVLLWGNNEIANYFIIENIVLSQAPYVKLKIILYGENAKEEYENTLNKYPFIEQFVYLEYLPLYNHTFLFQDEQYQLVVKQLKDLKAAYVFADNDEDTIVKSGHLRQFLHNQVGLISAIPVVAVLPDNSSIISLLNDSVNKTQILKVYEEKLNVNYINIYEDACTSEHVIFQTEIQDFAAKTVNYMYAVKYELPYLLSDHQYKITEEKQKALENTLFRMRLTTMQPLEEIDQVLSKKLNELCGVPQDFYYTHLSIDKKWFGLTDRKKDSNRYVARHLKLKMHFLKAMGYDRIDYDTIQELFHILAPIEHQRWLSEKLVFGFCYGSLADKKRKKELKDVLKIHDQIIPYTQLTHEEQSKDMDMFFLIPLMNQIFSIQKDKSLKMS